MVYQWRVYWAAPGKREALHHRFRTLTLSLFARHNMQVVGFWTPNPATEETGDLVYMLAFSDPDAVTQAWAAFSTDPEWQAGKAASEVEGKLVSKLTSTLLEPTDYSPLQ